MLPHDHFSGRLTHVSQTACEPSEPQPLTWTFAELPGLGGTTEGGIGSNYLNREKGGD